MKTNQTDPRVPTADGEVICSCQRRQASQREQLQALQSHLKTIFNPGIDMMVLFWSPLSHLKIKIL